LHLAGIYMTIIFVCCGSLHETRKGAVQKPQTFKF